ncbi:hypothetical protein Sjap_019966 [Stephania japonica]|uniref:Uncharacterized protein n=1 Tax=Stephania japonica TaxID=461633 RepID=A0AAP0F2M7_9MAGN
MDLSRATARSSPIPALWKVGTPPNVVEAKPQEYFSGQVGLQIWNVGFPLISHVKRQHPSNSKLVSQLNA